MCRLLIRDAGVWDRGYTAKAGGGERVLALACLLP
jgi:hypothetical protein